MTGMLRRRGLEADAVVRLSRLRSPSGPVLVQVNLGMERMSMRTQIVGPSSLAWGLACDRLDRRLDRLTVGAAPRWRADPPRAGALAYESAHTPIVRRETAALVTCDPVRAVALMDEMDYDAFVFTDRETGEDAMVCWIGPIGVRLARQYLTDRPRTDAMPALSITPAQTRTLSETDAVARLCGRGLPFLFFTDRHDGRGRLLYRRYDGELALIVPAARG
ncbi:hypothetical protein NS14008_14985 [Nocardia seriolae]|nr:hypothetical protein NS14008_14985 [Nocardia seriolae]PSK29422.1 hypothetical protein C6575_21355 [Nocardia seriolae]RLP30065.1 hypothetical protein D6158_20370 [Nocardia seriolae]